MSALRRHDTVEEPVDLGGRRVRLVRPRSPDDLLEQAAARGARSAPYWAELWPSARGLAEHLAGQDLSGLRSVELGCGIGLGSVGAALGGADVLATDIEPDAVAFAAENGRRAIGRRIATLVVDVADLPAALLERGPFDLVLAADVLYEEALAAAVAAAIPRLLAPGGSALVAYPWRGQGEALGHSLAAGGLRVTHGELQTLERGRPFTVRLVRVESPT